MTTKIVLLLSMSLNVLLAFVIVENNRKPVSLGDFRDAIADTPIPVQTPEAAPAEMLPPPAVETVLAEAAPAAAAVAETIAPAPVIVANDWAAYRQEMADDRDVLVSNIFRSENTAQRAMRTAVSRLYASGKDVLFYCVLPATGGGVFYLVRTVSDRSEERRGG